MAYDKELMFRTTGDLTADEAGTFVAVPEGGNMTLRVVVPEMAEANDTIVVKIHLSDDGTNTDETITMKTITKAGVDAGKHEYFSKVFTPRAYIKVEFDITDADAGTDFDAGVVLAGLVPAGRYNNW
jgi:hypothetical protein